MPRFHSVCDLERQVRRRDRGCAGAAAPHRRDRQPRRPDLPCRLAMPGSARVCERAEIAGRHPGSRRRVPRDRRRRRLPDRLCRRRSAAALRLSSRRSAPAGPARPCRPVPPDLRARPGPGGGGLLAGGEGRVPARRPLYLNDGAYGSLADMKMFRTVYPMRLLRPAAPASRGWPAIALFGPTCDSYDSLPGTVPLPEDVREGDWIEIRPDRRLFQRAADPVQRLRGPPLRAGATTARCARPRPRGRHEDGGGRASVPRARPGGFHRLAYVDWGEDRAKPPVLCVHGLTRNSRDFDWLARTWPGPAAGSSARTSSAAAGATGSPTRRSTAIRNISATPRR